MRKGVFHNEEGFCREEACGEVSAVTHHPHHDSERTAQGDGPCAARSGCGRGCAMNMEQRQKVMRAIREREILLSWALGHGEKDEAERLEREIRSLMAAF